MLRQRPQQMDVYYMWSRKPYNSDAHQPRNHRQTDTGRHADFSTDSVGTPI
jgi:hypothetical protein